MTVKMTKVSLYGSIALIIGAILISIIVNVGIKGLFILIVIIAAIVGAFYIFFRIVPEKWALTILFLGFITFIQYTSQSWLFSISLIIPMLIYVLFHALKMARLWRGTALVLFYIVMVGGTVYYSEYMPEIEQQALNEVSEEMMENQQVENITLEADEQGVHCFLVVKDDVLVKDRTEIGEACAKKLSEKVELKSKRFHETNEEVGELYDYHGLTLDVIPGKDGKPLTASKGSSEEAMNWKISSFGEKQQRYHLTSYDLVGHRLTMTVGYDSHKLDLDAKDIQIFFSSEDVAKVEKDGETRKYDYLIERENEIIFKDGRERHHYRVDLVTEDELLFLEGHSDGKGYIFELN